MEISAAFESGSIDVIDASDPAQVRLALAKDKGGFVMWFHFRAIGPRDNDRAFRIENAGDATFPDGWRGYRACASYDGRTWIRVATEYDGRVLTIHDRPPVESVHYALAVPYSMERHRRFIAGLQRSPFVRVGVASRSVAGRDIDLVTVGEPAEGKAVCWVLGRQHAGETQASWFMEGFINRLIDPADAIAREALKGTVFHIVPNVNPDGSVDGFIRSNLAGANLNREWHDPSEVRSPEVFGVRRLMDETGVDFCLDIHADASVPFVYIEGGDAAPSTSDRNIELRERFERRLRDVNPDYEIDRRYPHLPVRGEGDLTMCLYQVAERYGALTVMLEMPFNDYDLAPDTRLGWSTDRSRRMGQSTLDAFYAVLPDLVP